MIHDNNKIQFEESVHLAHILQSHIIQSATNISRAIAAKRDKGNFQSRVETDLAVALEITSEIAARLNARLISDETTIIALPGEEVS